MSEPAEEQALDFYIYPPIGGDDWRYAYATAKVRTLQTQMIPKSTLLDMTNAGSFEQALDLLSSTGYALSSSSRTSAELEEVLLSRRADLREQFARLMLDDAIAELFKSRDDFANIRLAVRRVVSDKAVGTGYSSEGNVEPEIFKEVFEEEHYELLPEHIRYAVEQAILAYYHKKDIRQIDYTIDRIQSEYNLETAGKLKSAFLTGIFRIQVDIRNINIMLRLKFRESEERDLFLPGGYINIERFEQGLDLEYESIGQVFYATPYYSIISNSSNYVGAKKSFLKAEQLCENYLSGYLHSSIQITAGPQPVIAYLLENEKEIRNIRLILTAKKNLLDKRMILDRIGE